jgi:hypothetical protein
MSDNVIPFPRKQGGEVMTPDQTADQTEKPTAENEMRVTLRQQLFRRASAIRERAEKRGVKMSPMERRLVAERMHRLIGSVKAETGMTRGEFAEQAFNLDRKEKEKLDCHVAASKLRHYTLNPRLEGKKRDEREKQLAQSPKQYFRLICHAAKKLGREESAVIVETFEGTSLDLDSEALADLERLQPYEQFTDLLYELALRIGKRTDLARYYRALTREGFSWDRFSFVPRLYSPGIDWRSDSIAKGKLGFAFDMDPVTVIPLPDPVTVIPLPGIGIVPSVLLYRRMAGEPLPVRIERSRERIALNDVPVNVDEYLKTREGNRFAAHGLFAGAKMSREQGWILAFEEVRLALVPKDEQGNSKPVFEKRPIAILRTAKDQNALESGDYCQFFPLDRYACLYFNDPISNELVFDAQGIYRCRLLDVDTGELLSDIPGLDDALDEGDLDPELIFYEKVRPASVSRYLVTESGKYRSEWNVEDPGSSSIDSISHSEFPTGTLVSYHLNVDRNGEEFVIWQQPKPERC